MKNQGKIYIYDILFDNNVKADYHSERRRVHRILQKDSEMTRIFGKWIPWGHQLYSGVRVDDQVTLTVNLGNTMA